jgi:phosphoglycerate dehydrogenase-like enzyme
VLTAHLAGALPEALHEIGHLIVQDLKAVLAGTQPRCLQYATPRLIASLRQAL